ncbi:hypothetical protein [Sphingobacterium siyangense]|uniref:hypothetical protein n=1 Tax=Sphingobacterium siyangense TaxID=459529 RepID=UPI003DA57576
MKLSYIHKRNIKRIWVRFKPLFILYALLWLVWFYLRIDIDFDVKSWFASFTEDLLFFGTAILGIILSVKMPHDENFSTRVGALCNGNFAHKEAEGFLEQEIIRLMTYNKSHHIKITLDKIDKNRKHVLVHIDSECEIVNMCSDENIPYSLKSYIVPGPQIEGTHGAVIHHSIRFSKNGIINEKETKYLIPKHKTSRISEIKDNRYVCDEQFQISGNGSVITNLCYEIWLPLGGDVNNYADNWLFAGMTNYTGEFSISILNNVLDSDFYFQARWPDRNAPQLHLDKSEVIYHSDYGKVASENEVHPFAKKLKFKKDDRFELYFSNFETNTGETMKKHIDSPGGGNGGG